MSILTQYIGPCYNTAQLSYKLQNIIVIGLVGNETLTNAFLKISKSNCNLVCGPNTSGLFY